MKNPLYGMMRTIMLLMISLLVFRCSDDDDDQNTQTSNLLLGTWEVTGDVISPPIDFGTGPVSDLFAIMDPCDKDDLYIIKTGGVGEFNEGPTKCDPADPQTEPFTWSLQNNDKNLIISEGGNSLTFEIVQLNNTTMILKIQEDILGTVYTETINYRRK